MTKLTKSIATKITKKMYDALPSETEVRQFIKAIDKNEACPTDNELAKLVFNTAKDIKKELEPPEISVEERRISSRKSDATMVMILAGAVGLMALGTGIGALIDEILWLDITSCALFFASISLLILGDDMHDNVSTDKYSAENIRKKLKDFLHTCLNRMRK